MKRDNSISHLRCNYTYNKVKKYICKITIQMLGNKNRAILEPLIFSTFSFCICSLFVFLYK